MLNGSGFTIRSVTRQHRSQSLKGRIQREPRGLGAGTRGRFMFWNAGQNRCDWSHLTRKGRSRALISPLQGSSMFSGYAPVSALPLLCARAVVPCVWPPCWKCHPRISAGAVQLTVSFTTTIFMARFLPPDVSQPRDLECGCVFLLLRHWHNRKIGPSRSREIDRETPPPRLGEGVAIALSLRWRLR